MKRNDIIIIVSIVLLSAVTALINQMFKGTGENAKVQVMVDGKMQSEYVLSEYPPGKEKTIVVQTNSGYNEILISSGGVKITDSDCPAHDCINMHSITKAGEIIVCLHHRLIVKITGNNCKIPEVDIVAG